MCTKYEIIKNTIEIIMNLFVIFGIIAGFFIFKYKHDGNTRNLYVENARTVDKVLGYHFQTANVEQEHIDMLNQAYRDALL